MRNLVLRDERIRALLSDTLLISLGNLAVKLIQFVLLPIYTANMTTSQFGVAELLNSGVELAYPLVCLGLYEATFRFAMDEGADHRVLMTNSLAVWATGVALLLPLGALVDLLSDAVYVWHVIALLALYSCRLLLAQYARGSNRVRVFVASGALSAFVLLIFTFLFVAIRRMGVEGYLFAMIVAHAIAVVYLLLRLRIRRLLRPSIDRAYLGEMVSYSLPLVPNSLAWWFNNISSRYVVEIFWGVQSAGLFVAAGKIPAIINLFTQVFQQAWQISAVGASSERCIAAYSSKVFRGYALSMTATTSIAILLVEPIATILLAKDFYESRFFIPLLMFAMLLTSLSSFLGAFYAASKKSGMLLRSTIAGAVLCVALSAILTPLLGIWGSVMGLICSNALIAGWRFVEVRSLVRMEFSHGRLCSGLMLVLVQALLASIDSLATRYASWIAAAFVAVLALHVLLSPNPRKFVDEGEP